jgi:hypothetical protein
MFVQKSPGIAGSFGSGNEILTNGVGVRPTHFTYCTIHEKFWTKSTPGLNFRNAVCFCQLSRSDPIVFCDFMAFTTLSISLNGVDFDSV